MSAPEPKPPIPQTREEMATALRNAWLRSAVNSGSADFAWLPTVDLVLSWLAAARAQAFEEAARICDQCAEVGAPAESAAHNIRFLAIKDSGQ